MATAAPAAAARLPVPPPAAEPPPAGTPSAAALAPRKAGRRSPVQAPPPAGAPRAKAPAPGKRAARPVPSLPRTQAPPPWAPGGGPPAKAPSGYAASAAGTASDWAFLSDRTMPIEQKLALFCARVVEKTDRDLEALMARYKAAYVDKPSAGTGAGGAKKGTSVFDVVKSIVPGLGIAEQVIGEAGLRKAATAMGGPVLAALATAAGFPALAPAALAAAGDFVQLAFTDVGGAKGSTGSSATPRAPGSPDEKLAMLEIQLAVEKQQRMFAAVTNTLKVMHDAQMVAVHNLR